jgi:hypothetical protein
MVTVAFAALEKAARAKTAHAILYVSLRFMEISPSGRL